MIIGWAWLVVLVMLIDVLDHDTGLGHTLSQDLFKFFIGKLKHDSWEYEIGIFNWNQARLKSSLTFLEYLNTIFWSFVENWNGRIALVTSINWFLIVAWISAYHQVSSEPLSNLNTVTIKTCFLLEIDDLQDLEMKYFSDSKHLLNASQISFSRLSS